MQRLTLFACASLIVAALSTSAGAANTQQDRMKTCNASAKSANLSGDARKDYMSRCLSGETAAANSQQEKMKTCNADATKQQLKGDDRKKFMSTCLKAG